MKEGNQDITISKSHFSISVTTYRRNGHRLVTKENNLSNSKYTVKKHIFLWVIILQNSQFWARLKN